MTHVYFVRHAEPVHSWEDDRSRPLTPAGQDDSAKVTEFLSGINVDSFFCSPYKRSLDTISGSAAEHKLPIRTDERLRERMSGPGGKDFGMFGKRWSDFDFCEPGGETLKSTQVRNIEALLEILTKHRDENIVIGTHGTALSLILNYFAPDFGCDGFLRIIDFMPFIIRIDFDGTEYAGREEVLIIKKEFTGAKRADRP